MTGFQPSPARRSRRAERAQRMEHSPEQKDWAPNAEMTAGEPAQEPQPFWAQDAADADSREDLSAYYSRSGESTGQAEQPAFAPPVKLKHYALQNEEQPLQTEDEPGQNHMYRPLQATWAEQEREEVQQDYEVHEEALPEKKKRRVSWKLWLIVPALALLAGAVWLLRQPLAQLAGMEHLLEQATPQPTAVLATPEPVKAYDAAPAAELSGTARSAIDQLSGNAQLETFIVTDRHIAARHRRAGGAYDFYLFTAAEGRLLCYFEGLDALDMIPQEDGVFYVKQEPYLIAPSGAALIRTDSLEAMLGESLTLQPLHRGWAIVRSEADGSANYISKDSQLLSTLWFSRTFPFTGAHTLAYVDTGSAGNANQRYLLYVLSEDGTMTRWMAAGDMTDVTASACAMAYMKDGSLYRLPDTSAPAAAASEVHAWLDCGALAVRDRETGKYGLFVNGEQHYDYLYDSIRPVESDLTWESRTTQGEGGSFTVYAVSGASYPLPLSHSFELTREDGQTEYVALSTLSSYPILLDDEF